MTTTSAQDRDGTAMMALYHATNGDGWARRGGWGTDAPLGQWHGVTTDAGGRVARLALNNNKLSGAIPGALGNLTALTVLDLDNNKLSGALPGALGKLTALTHLHIDNNELSGAIPDALGNLTALTVLDLDNNKLSGALPGALGKLTALTHLHIDNNELSGAIPDALGNLTALTDLRLYENRLSGAIPDALGNLTALTDLRLDNNELSGVIPDALGNLTALTVLDLDNNKLSGALPDALGKLAALTFLRLDNNKLSGAIPGALGNLTALTVLDLDNNKLSGALPGALGKLTALTHLHIDNNELSGAIPDALGNLTALTVLDLDNNKLSGAIPDALGKLTALTHLHIDNNELSGAIPKALGNLGALTEMYLYENQLSGAIPDALGNLTALAHLHIDNNELSGVIPDALGKLTALTHLRLDNNELSGVIPDALGKLTALTHLRLDNNELSGAIPRDLAELGRVREVRFDGNAGLKVGGWPAGNRFDLRTGGRIEGPRDTSAPTFDRPIPPAPTFEVERRTGGAPVPPTSPVLVSNERVDTSKETATFHRYAVAPIDLYGKRGGAVQSVGSGLRTVLASIEDWEDFAVEKLHSVFAHDTLKRRLGMRCVEAYKYVGDHGLLKDPGGEAYALLFVARDDEVEEGDATAPLDDKGQTGGARLQLSLLLHEQIELEATQPEPGMHPRIKWAMSLAEKPPEWLRERLPYNPPAALARAVWIWWHQRSLRHKWRDQVTGFVRDRLGELQRKLDLLKGDEHVFAFSALKMHSPERGSEEEWREHFITTTMLALDILNALDDDIPLTVRAMEAEEFGCGTYRDLMLTHRRLRDLRGDSDADDLQPPALRKALEEIAGTGGKMPGTLESIDLEEARRGLERHLAVRGPRRSVDAERSREGVGEGRSQPGGSAGFGLDWRDLEDEEHSHALVAVEADTVILTTSKDSHVLEMAALEIALHSVASEFAAASGAILENHQATPSRERDEAEDELLDSLSDQLLRVTRWRTQLTGWPRAMFERLQATSRLDQNIQAFYDASRESVQRAQIREQKATSKRESDFQRVLTVAGVAFAAVVLGEITISIGDESDVGNTVAVLLGGAALFFGAWLTWSLNEDRPALGKKHHAVLAQSGKGILFILTGVMLATMVATTLGLPIFEWWWPWPGLPLLCVCLGACTVISLLEVLQREGWLWRRVRAARIWLWKPWL